MRGVPITAQYNLGDDGRRIPAGEMLQLGQSEADLHQGSKNVRWHERLLGRVWLVLLDVHAHRSAHRAFLKTTPPGQMG